MMIRRGARSPAAPRITWPGRLLRGWRFDRNPAVAGTLMTTLMIGSVARHAIDRRRMAEWDADWFASGPRWTSMR